MQPRLTGSTVTVWVAITWLVFAVAPCSSAGSCGRGCVLIEGDGSDPTAPAYVHMALSDPEITEIVLTAPRYQLKPTLWAQYGGTNLLVLNRNFTVRSTIRPYGLMDFQQLERKVLLAAGVTVRFESIILQNIRKLGGFSLDFFMGEEGSTIMLNDVVRVKLACLLPQDVYSAARSFKRVSDAYPENSVRLLEDYCFIGALSYTDAVQPHCFRDTLHFQDFSVLAGSNDPDAGLQYAGYVLFQQNTTNVCLNTITPECVRTQGDEVCLAILIADASQEMKAPFVWSPGAIAGICIAGGVVLAALALCCVCRRRILLCVLRMNAKTRQELEGDSSHQLPEDGFEHKELEYGSSLSSGYAGRRAISQQVTLGALLGAGSFGRVYKGRWHSSDVAIKIMSCTRAELPKVLKEAEVMMQLNHPNIVRAFHASVWNPAEQMRALQAREARGIENTNKPPARQPSGRLNCADAAQFASNSIISTLAGRPEPQYTSQADANALAPAGSAPTAEGWGATAINGAAVAQQHNQPNSIVINIRSDLVNTPPQTNLAVPPVSVVATSSSGNDGSFAGATCSVEDTAHQFDHSAVATSNGVAFLSDSLTAGNRRADQAIGVAGVNRLSLVPGAASLAGLHSAIVAPGLNASTAAAPGAIVVSAVKGPPLQLGGSSDGRTASCGQLSGEPQVLSNGLIPCPTPKQQTLQLAAADMTLSSTSIETVDAGSSSSFAASAAAAAAAGDGAGRKQGAVRRQLRSKRGRTSSSESSQPASADATSTTGGLDAAASAMKGAQLQRGADQAGLAHAEQHESDYDAQAIENATSKAEVQVWIVLELCTGGTLKDAVSSNRINLDDATGLAKLLSRLLETASGMAYLHSKGVVHGDLKAGNVLLQNAHATQVAKISDFGLAAVLLDGATHRSTASMGTITHMAPEVLRSGHMSPAADVYSFGIMMWEVFTKKQAYQGLHYGAVVERVVIQKERPPIPGDMPEEFSLLMCACWDAEPNNRPSFAQIVKCLEIMLSGLEHAVEEPNGALRNAGAQNAANSVQGSALLSSSEIGDVSGQVTAAAVSSDFNVASTSSSGLQQHRQQVPWQQQSQDSLPGQGVWSPVIQQRTSNSSTPRWAQREIAQQQLQPLQYQIGPVDGSGGGSTAVHATPKTHSTQQSRSGQVSQQLGSGSVVLDENMYLQDL